MMHFFNNKWLQLVANLVAFVLFLVVTLLAFDSLLRGMFVFGETPRGIPVGTGTILVLGPFMLVYFVLIARKLLRQGRKSKRGFKR